MREIIKIGVLSFHGDVSEHIAALKLAAKKLYSDATIVPVSTKTDLDGLKAIVIPGGESPTLQKLCQRAGMWERLKRIKNIFGTCAGTIMLAKTVSHKAPGQTSFRLMDIKVDRNAYGRQADSFEKEINTAFGKINAVFIRAPKIIFASKNVKVLAKENGKILACEQKGDNYYYLAVCFHPELTTTKFHEHFLKQAALGKS